MKEISKMSCLLRPAGLFLLVGLVAAALCAAPVWASKAPSDSNCKKQSDIAVRCIICKTGQLVGKTTVGAQYDPKHEDCMMRYKEAYEKCIRLYNMRRSTAGVQMYHVTDGKTYRAWYPDYCDHW